MLSPLLIVLGIILAYPLIYSLWLAFRDFDLTGGTGSNFVGLQQFAYTLTDAMYWDVLKHTLIFVVVAVCLELLLGFLIALALLRLRTGRELARALLLAPMFVTPIAVGLLFRFLLDNQLGVVPEILSDVGISVPFFGSTTALYTLALIDVWQWTPFMVLLLLAGLQNIPADQLEAASIDGAGLVRRFFNITLPILRPVVITAVLIRALDATRVYEYVYAITQGGPGTSTMTLQYYVYKTGFSHYRMSEAAAIGWTVVVIVMVLIVVLLWRSSKESKG